MGGVPKKRHTKSARNQRRMHLFLTKPQFKKCGKCGVLSVSHIVCPACGFYKDKEAVNVLAKLDRKERKAKDKEMKSVEKESEAEAKTAPK
jgi:large subunit ribosomal protein L32